MPESAKPMADRPDPMTASRPSPRGSRRVQMADIARLAGVSTSTVSRALNGSPLINEETRQRVGELAKALNYTVNLGAKNLRLGENRTIGMVIPFDSRTRQHISDPFFLGMLGSLADALTDRGYDMLVSRVDAEHLDGMAALYDSGRAAGVMVIGQWGHHDQLNALAMRQVPLVVWGAQLPRQFYCSVGGDNISGGRLATQHLLSRGRRRIAFMGDTQLPEVALRHQGYAEALRAAGLEPDPALHIPAPFTAEQARAEMQAWLARGVPFDAVFATSDLIAMTAIGLLRGQGFSVPQGVSVVGYDDVEAASHGDPPLTTIKQPIDQAGIAMVECMLALLAGEPVESRVLPTSLVLRGSTAPVIAAA